jgi:plasmid maintenance system antidote protein VapI
MKIKVEDYEARMLAIQRAVYENKIRQTALARETGIAQGNISRMIRGKSKLKSATLDRLERAIDNILNRT